MMRPYFRSSILRPKIWQARRVPVKLVSMMEFHSSSPTSSVGVRFVLPAQFTRISTLPNSAQVALTNASRLERSVTSDAKARDLPPALVIFATAASTRSTRRLVGTTFAPACASPVDRAKPIPEVPPMTTAVLEERSSAGCPIAIKNALA